MDETPHDRAELQAGQEFVPYRQFREVLVIPEALLRHPALSPGAVLLYGVLTRHAGRDGACYPGEDRLAATMNTSARQIRRYLTELRDAELITWTRRPNRSSIFRFVWQECLGGSDRTEMSTPDRTEMSTPDRTETSTPDRTETSAGKESGVKGSPERGNADLDYAPTPRKNGAPTPQAGAVLAPVRDLVHTVLGRRPTEQQTTRILEAGRGTSPDVLADALRLAVSRSPEPPQTLRWFQVAAGEHADLVARLRPAAPAATDYRMSSEQAGGIVDAAL